MKKFKHLYLTGCMGSGKTTVGELLATKLGRPFLDLDSLIVEQQGKSINQIFAEVGEEGFRQIETETLDSLEKNKRYIIATGGGIVLKEENRKKMKENGAVIFLDAPARELAERLEGDHSRPLLRGENRAEKLEQILSERMDFYRDCTLRVDISHKTPLQAVTEIIKWLK